MNYVSRMEFAVILDLPEFDDIQELIILKNIIKINRNEVDRII